MDYEQISKETIGLIYQSRASLAKSPVDATLRILAELRVSQINGCSYCCRLHTAEARELGVSQETLDLLPVWRNATSFTDEERIVLEWAESLTLVDQDLDEIKERLKALYSEREIVDLTLCISIMNTLNRIAISLRD